MGQSRPADDAAPLGGPRLSRRHLLRQGVAVVALAGLGVRLTPSAFAQPATAAASPYRLPWRGGRTFQVSQTQGSSHQGAMQHAIDFALPLGETVLAARGGTVAFREDGFSACGGPNLATRGNYVVIDHGDGTSALYLHLHQVRVRVGQTVAQGTVLGTAGSTGWTGCTAHLHFQLQQTWGVWFARSLPVAFGDPDVLAHDPAGRVHYNQEYRSGNDGGSGSAAASDAPAAAPVLVAGTVHRAAAGSARLALTAWLREQPTRQSRALGLVPAGATVELETIVTGEEVEPGEARWARVSHGGRTVYLYWGVLAPDSVAAPAGGTAVTRVAASLRASPTTASARLNLLPPGTPVQVLEEVAGQALDEGGDRWARVRTDRGEGFIYQSLLQTG